MALERHEELAESSRADLLRRTHKADERLTPLFRRWPALSELELHELRRVYAERQRLAKHLGKLRRTRGPARS